MKGITAISGMAAAAACVIRSPQINSEKRLISDINDELARLEQVKKSCADQLEGISASAGLADETIEILDFQLLMLEDTDYFGKIEEVIKQGICCEYAVHTASEEYITYLENITDNDYLRERAADVGDLSKRLLCILQGVAFDFSEPMGDYIVVAEDLTPSQVAGMSPKKLKGILLEKGGLSSHCVIIAKSLGIPCIIQVTGLMDGVNDGEELLLDAVHSEVVPSPGEEGLKEYRRFCASAALEQQELEPFRFRKSVTLDGAEMKVFANITTAKEAQAAVAEGAEGVGLFRSELLYMGGKSAPSEETQLEEYGGAAKALDGRPLIIRTLDVGGDKEIGYLGIPKEENPFLGYRAIRYCLDNRELFATQISAIWRASAYGNVSVMFPMITGVDEVRAAKALIEDVKRQQTARGAASLPELKVGIMIETPAAAFDAEILAREVDFFSIGTNDLTQYLFSADRGNPKVQTLNSCFQPALLRTINHVAQAARNVGIEVDICGAAGEIPELLPLFVAMGITAVSVSIPNITRVRKTICGLNKGECERLLQNILMQATEAGVKELLKIN